MQSTITPTDPYLCTVDLQSDQPGIVQSKDKIDIMRKEGPFPKITYALKRPPKPCEYKFDSNPSMTLEDAQSQLTKKKRKENQRLERIADQDLRKEADTLDKIEKREEGKRKRAEETTEEREARLQIAREKRAQKKTKNEQREEDTQPDQVVKEADAPIQLNLQDVLEQDCADTCTHILPQRLKANKQKTKFYASPVPFDRHLSALEAAWPASHIEDALVKGIPNQHVSIYRGPPGTGKTHTITHLLTKYPNQRILVCATTNIGTANLYARIVNAGFTDTAILVPPSRIPTDTPVLSQDPKQRIICSTISSRAGAILDNESFSVVFVDEAAQCMEAWFWGLVRPEVQDIIMVGDVQQLPALVSPDGVKYKHDRSLMQRLLEQGYPSTLLATQRRMHPEIAAYPIMAFYANTLITDYTPHPTLVSQPYTLHLCTGVCESVNESFVNKDEAQRCIQLAKDFSEVDTVILTPYQAQARQLLSLKSGIPVFTVDSFQGREADVVILSMVRTDTPGFWKDDRRLCVALTRARHVLKIVGHATMWSDNLLSLYQDAVSRNVFIQ